MLTDDDRDDLRDWWDEDATAGVESAFPIIARIVARERAVGWDEGARWASTQPAIYSHHGRVEGNPHARQSVDLDPTADHDPDAFIEAEAAAEAHAREIVTTGRAPHATAFEADGEEWG